MSVKDYKIPSCPQCDGEMTLRKSVHGEFWGCRRFPACRGSRKKGEETKIIAKEVSKYTPIVKSSGSDEQEAIWNCMLNSKTNMLVKAAPGTGKTWTAVQGCLRQPHRYQTLIVAFNKHIAVEATGKLQASNIFNTSAATYHSVGNSILKFNFKALKTAKPDDEKMPRILERLYPKPMFGEPGAFGMWRKRMSLAKKLVGYTKNYLVDWKANDFTSRMELIADHHDLDSVDASWRDALMLVPSALNECIRQAETCIDFDDMPWLPVVMDLDVPDSLYANMVITDESQDLAPVQHALMFRLGDRFMAVGDPHQSIYGFRGASVDSMDIIEKRMSERPEGVETFPLTITYRCPKLHVHMARALYPEIQAVDDAPMGSIEEMTPETATSIMKPGDLVICRCNQPLIATAYALIRRGVRPHIIGRDIGEGLIKMLDVLERAAEVIPDPDPMRALSQALDLYAAENATRLMALGAKGEKRLDALHDRCDCMREFVAHAGSIVEIRERIFQMFESNEGGLPVTLGTVHRTKGLEAHRIFILAPELIPHPMAKEGWEMVQEKNLAWVASTRAKFTRSDPESGAMIFCGRIPGIFQVSPTEPVLDHRDKLAIEPDPLPVIDNDYEDEVPF